MSPAPATPLRFARYYCVYGLACRGPCQLRSRGHTTSKLDAQHAGDFRLPPACVDGEIARSMPGLCHISHGAARAARRSIRRFGTA